MFATLLLLLIVMQVKSSSHLKFAKSETLYNNTYLRRSIPELHVLSQNGPSFENTCNILNNIKLKFYKLQFLSYHFRKCNENITFKIY